MAGVKHAVLSGAELGDRGGSIRAFLDHYDRAKGSKAMASRADIKPEELKPFLPMMMIFNLHFDDEGALIDGTVRLQGTELEHFYGDFTGRSFTEHPNRNLSERIFKGLRKMLDVKAPIVTLADGEITDERRMVVESVYAPLSEDDETITKMVGFVRVTRSVPKL